jgi:DNA polymerase phi
MKSVQLLKILSQHPNHLQGQPIKALVDILSEVENHKSCRLIWETLKRFG